MKSISNYIKQCNRLILRLSLILLAVPAFGQTLQKKPVTAADYQKWAKLYAGSLSESGKWISYKMDYDGQQDTLVVRSTGSENEIFLVNGSDGTFNGDLQFACRQDDTLKLLDLKKRELLSFNDVQQFAFTGNKKFLATLHKNKEQEWLSLRTAAGTQLDSIPGISDISLSADGRALACTGTARSSFVLIVITFNGKINKIEIGNSAIAPYMHAVWNPCGGALAYLHSNDKGERIIGFYTVEDRHHTSLLPSATEGFPKGFQVPEGYASGLTVSPDGKRVLFYARKTPPDIGTKDVQIWNGNDALTYPERDYLGIEGFNGCTISWLPYEQKIIQVTDAEKQVAYLNASQDYALVYALDDLGPQYRLDRNVNYYVTDITTGKRTPLLENQSTALSDSGYSPAGKYFAYFRQGSWFAYSFKSGKKIRLTNGNTISDFASLDEFGALIPEGIAGWGPDDLYLLLYDRYDIWKVYMDGRDAERLTSGRESKVRMRLVQTKPSLHANFTGRTDPAFDLKTDLLLRGTSEQQTGYFLRYNNGTVKAIVSDGNYNHGIIGSRDGSSFAYLAENHNLPPQLIYWNRFTGEGSKIKQSNPHHFDYSWGKQEVVEYKNAAGKSLKGLLYYPAGYTPENQYPMVVHIYEKQFFEKGYYRYPSLKNITGFNIANLTAEGYFVLLPDIEYEIGNPGLSATDCVLAAVDAACKNRAIDAKRIGLIGHSFGGYETNFIMTQTDKFACAISGSSVADLQGWYLSIGWNSGQPEIWRAETQQWRIGKSLFDDMETYTRNSPLHKIKDVRAPLLLWTGEQDRQVHYYQSIAFYLALRRLNKEVIMLVYPDERHGLMQAESQVDLTHRVQSWFDHFLKGETPPPWITSGIKTR